LWESIKMDNANYYMISMGWNLDVKITNPRQFRYQSRFLHQLSFSKFALSRNGRIHTGLGLSFFFMKIKVFDTDSRKRRLWSL